MNTIRLLLRSLRSPLIKLLTSRSAMFSLRVSWLALCVAIVAAAAFFMASPASAMPPLGNGALGTRAEAVFYIENDPAQMRVISNTVSVQLAAVRALAFSHAPQVTVQAGQAFTIPLALRNQGNVAASYILTMQSAQNGTLALVSDLDGNGRKHAGALALDLTQSRTLEYAKQDALLLTGIAPQEASEGSAYEIKISAIGAPGIPNAAPAVDTVLTLLVDAKPSPNVSLEASRHKLDAGEQTTLTARIANYTKQELLADKAVVIDERATQATLLRYRIPAGMRFVDGNAPAGAGTSALLFATNSGPEFNYRTTRPAQVGEVAIALRAPLRPGQSRQMTMTLQRDANVSLAAIESRAEAYDSAALQPALSNLLVLEMAERGSPDLEPFINQSDTGKADASTWIEIGVKNIGAAATDGNVLLQAELPFALRDADLKATDWQCAIRRTASGSMLECSNPASLQSGAELPPVLVNVLREAQPGANGNACGPTKMIRATVSVPNEAENLRGNNRAEAPLLCKNGAVLSGRAWIDASNDGVYRRGEETLPGWRAQLLHGGKVVAEALTDHAGRYRMTGILPDTGYRLRFLSPQGRVEAAPVQGKEGGAGASELRARADFLGGELVYESLLSAKEYPEQNLALLPTGVVFDNHSGQPLAHAKVTLSGPKGFVPAKHLLGGDSHITAGTDEHGRYNFFLTPDAPAGIYRWNVALDGYEMPRTDDVLQLNAKVPAGHTERVWPVHKVLGETMPVMKDGNAGDSAARAIGYLIMNRVQGARKVVNNHLGLDPLVNGGELSLQKSADRKSVEQIDFFHYTLKLSHRRATAFSGFILDDSLPRGLRYVPGSARLVSGEGTSGTTGATDGSVLPDPVLSGSASGQGGVTHLQFDFSGTPLLPGSPMEIRYRVAVGATAVEGAKLVSYATARAGSETAQAQAAIRIRGGVFSDDAFVLGKVFLDCNGDGAQNADEAGVPGVRIYLEDGRFAETDRDGKYSLYGIAPLTHVLKMDPMTLPASARALVLSNRHAGRGDLRFLDLRNGELGRGDFALSCNAAVQAEVAYRKDQLVNAGDELDSALKLRFDAEAKTEEGTPTLQGDRASGWVGDGAKRNAPATSAATSAAPSTEIASTAAMAPPPASVTSTATLAATSSTPSLDTLLRGDTALALVGLADGQILASDFTDVTVLGSDAADFVLTVNGNVVSQQQIGQRSALASRHAAAWTYIAVRLHSGKNVIAVRQGTQQSEVEVIVPGSAARMAITAPPAAALLADGTSPVALTITLYDRDGVPATAPSLVTLHGEHVAWLTPDANPDARGLQVLVKDGQATVLLKAPTEAGNLPIRAELGALEQIVDLPFLPALRPMVAAGIVEGTVSLNNGRIETGGNNGFERELRSFARGSADGKQAMAGRSAFFLKGQVKGEYLLTASFDSDKDARERLFRDIEPDKYYPVYGDDAVRGFDAQSSSKLYLRIDKERSYLLLGDFNTGQSSPMRQLTQYSRAVNGVAHHLEQGPITANVFASRDNLRQQVITFAAENTRFYPGKLPPFYVEGSERVEIVTQDRAQGGIGQKVRTLARFADYTIDELSGSVKVTEAVTRLDPETGGLNSYRITFEVEEGAVQSWLYGGDVSVKPTPASTVGVMAVNDDNPNQRRQLRGVFGSWQVGPQTVIDGELAQTTIGEDITRAGSSNGSSGNNGNNGNSDTPIGSGLGWRVGAKHTGERLQSELAVVGTSDAFSNLSAPVAGGRFEARAKNHYVIDAQTKLKTEVLRTRDRLASGPRYGSVLDTTAEQPGDGVSYTGVLVGVERDLGTGLKVELGMRAVRGEIDRSRGSNNNASNNGNNGNNDSELDLLTARSRVTSVVPGLPQASIYGEVEQDVRDREKRALALGADYALPGKGRVYARHELLSSLGSAYEIEENARSYRTLVGIEGDTMQGGQAFSEYRGARPLTERGPEAAYGTRNAWQINDKLNVRASVERTHSLGGGRDGKQGGSDASSMSTVVEYRHSAQLKGTTGLDVRLADADTSYLYTLGVGYKIDDSWTVLGKNALYLVRGKGQAGAGRDQLRARQRLGLAYRQAQGTGLNALGYYEHRRQRNGGQGLHATDNETAHIVSLHANAQPARHWDVSGRYAGKFKRMAGNHGHSRVQGHLVSGRVTHDLGKRWDAGLAAALFADSLGQRKQAFGAEVGYLLKDDLWLSVGYNAVGFTDKDFAGMAETQQGVYFRMRYKFDENSL